VKVNRQQLEAAIGREAVERIAAESRAAAEPRVFAELRPLTSERPSVSDEQRAFAAAMRTRLVIGR
jgi:hypothetical protein